MRNRIFFLFLLSIFTYASAAAQSRTSTVTGTVVDETGVPMIGALIMADTTASAVSDANGKFTLLRIPRTNVVFKVSFMGYETHRQTLLVGGTNFNLGTIMLNPSPVEIEGVTVKGVAPMARQKGDTVQYNASSFKVNPDADVSDLVSKMPGITIENGVVSSQGESVSRVYVDGKLLFGENAMDALNNLPADLIEGVEVFDEKTDEAKFSGFDDGQRNRAMNLVTKHKGKRFVEARVNGGYGAPLNDNNDIFKDRFLFRGNMNSFTDTNRITVFANAANISDRAAQMNRSGLFTDRNVGIGLFNNWRKKVELTLNYRYQDRQDVVERRTIQDWIVIDRIYNEERFSNDIEKTHRADARLEWKINSKNRILFTPSVSFQNDDVFERLKNSNVVNDTISSYTNNKTNSSGNDFSTRGNLLYTHVFSKPGRTINTNINYRLANESSEAFVIDNDPKSTNKRDQHNLNDIWNKNASARISYSEPLDSTQRLEFSYDFRIEDGRTERSVFNLLEDPEGGFLDPILSNFFSRNYYAHTGGIGYALNTPKTKLTAGVNFRNIRLFKDQTFPGIEKQTRSFYTWEPRAQLRRDITNSKNLTINYNSNTNVPSIDQLKRAVNDRNPIQLTAGNPNLKPSVLHNLRVRYQASNPGNASTYFLALFANMEHNRIGNRTEYFKDSTILTDYFNFVAIPGSQLTTPVNINGFFSGSLNGGYSFSVKNPGLKINLGLSYGFTRRPSYVVTEKGTYLNYANENNVGLRVGIESNITQNVDFSIRSFTQYGYVQNSVKNNSKVVRQNLTGRVNIIFLGGIVFNTDLSYNYQRTEVESAFTQDFFMWNAGLGRKFLRRRNAEVRLTVYDILKQNQNLMHTVSDQYVQDQWSNIIGRYAMLTFNYRFNSLNNMSRPANRGANDSLDGGQRRQGPPQGGGGMMGPPGGGPGGGRGGF